MTGADGQASVTATAGTIVGSYTVTALVCRRHDPGQLRADQQPRRGGVGGGGLGLGPGDDGGPGFASPLVVVVKDSYGNLVPGASVTFAAPSSAASAALTGSPATTAANGQASVTAMANTIAGTYTVTASVSGVTTRPASPDQQPRRGGVGGGGLGSGQAATVAQGFASPLVVVVKDSYGNLVPGASVTFAAPASGASATLISATATTAANGQAASRRRPTLLRAPTP